MLNKISISNFRSCYDTHLEFNHRVSALSGKNGAGKSNILKAIQWLSSAVSAEGIRTTAAGNMDEDSDEISFDINLKLDLNYHYRLIAPKSGRMSPGAISTRPGYSVRESLGLEVTGGHEQKLLERYGEEIRLAGRNEPIRISRATPSIAALLSLLPSEDPLQVHLNSVASFFSGVRYYELEEKPDARDHVTEQEYNDFKFRYDGESQLTSSVALRLIYMFSEYRDLWDELTRLVGPDGLGLFERMDIVFLEGGGLTTPRKEGTAAKTLYLPIFTPSDQMGGAGHSYPFSSLSVGTRRVLRIITSMLFDRRSLMLLEQPEDSIHPNLLRKLIDILRTYSFQSQIIFTTHSLEVLDLLRPEEVFLVDAHEGATSARKLSAEEIDRAKLFLQDEGSLSEFLEPLSET